MTTRLTLILVAALASAPVVFAPSGFRVHLSPMADSIADQDETMRVEAPAAHSSARCMVIESNLLRPYRAPNSASVQATRPIGLASGGAVACPHAASSRS